MCELFGVSSAGKVKCNELLREFFRHGVDNPDGWGIAAFDGNEVFLEKDPASSVESVRLKERMKEEIEEAVLLAHIRKASVGDVEYKNCHPFVRRDISDRSWTFMHNGTIFESPVLELYRDLQEGSTDSERILYYLIERINAKQIEKGMNLTPEERFLEVEETIRRIVPQNKLNLLIYDSDLLYVHANMRDMLHYWKKENALIFSTKPLNEEHWEKVPLCRLLAYRGGELIYSGEPHAYEYRDSERT